MAKSLSKKKSFVSRCWRFIRKALLICFILSIVLVVIDRFVPVWMTPLMVIRSAEAVFDGEAPKNDKTWVPIKEISPNMVQAVVSSEDNLFLKHHGFSFNDIEKAINSKNKKKRIRGGSTISQQTAKNVFLWPNRSYIRKGLEAYFTVLIELCWSKERIMEVYLNVIEMGDGIYGVEAASQAYFEKPASELTKSQAALIAACLPNPRRFKVDDPSGYIQRRQQKILYVMDRIPKVDFNKKEQESGSKHHRKKKK